MFCFLNLGNLKCSRLRPLEKALQCRNGSASICPVRQIHLTANRKHTYRYKTALDNFFIYFMSSLLRIFCANSANKLYYKESDLPASPYFILLAYLQNRKDALNERLK